MSKGLRLSEKWFNRGLWTIAIVFASFLIGLGGTIIGDLPHVTRDYRLDDFIQQPAAGKLRDALKLAQQSRSDLNEQAHQAQIRLDTANNDYNTAYASFNNWLATRSATEQASQDEALIQRTQALDSLKQQQRQRLDEVDALSQQQDQAAQAQQALQDELAVLEQVAQEKLDQQWRHQEIQVFLYRLMLTLPLLVIAGWLFAKKRKTAYWPFVWGFILFALFAFFVELVPYLPSYGGYVRYLVGIVLTVVIGRQAIIALNAYLEKQKLAEQLPDAQRRVELSYDIALARLAKQLCPGCERQVDLKDASIDFCPHCGIGLHDHCTQCQARKSAFAKFCHRCGCAAPQASAS